KACAPDAARAKVRNEARDARKTGLWGPRRALASRATRAGVREAVFRGVDRALRHLLFGARERLAGVGAIGSADPLELLRPRRVVRSDAGRWPGSTSPSRRLGVDFRC